MAEAMELDLTLKKLVDETIKNPIATPPDLIKNKDTKESNKIQRYSLYCEWSKWEIKGIDIGYISNYDIKHVEKLKYRVNIIPFSPSLGKSY